MKVVIVTERREYGEIIGDGLIKYFNNFFDNNKKITVKILYGQTVTYVYNLLYKLFLNWIPDFLIRIGTFGSDEYGVGNKIIVKESILDFCTSRLSDTSKINTREDIVEFFVSLGYKPASVKTIAFFGEKHHGTVDMETGVIYYLSKKKGIENFVSIGVVSDNMGKNIIDTKLLLGKMKECSLDVSKWLEQSI